MSIIFAGKINFIIIFNKGMSQWSNVRGVKQMTVVNDDTALVCLNLEAQESERSTSVA